MKDSENASTIEQLQSKLQQAKSTIKQLESKVDMYQGVINHLPHYYTFWKDLNYRFLGGDERFYQKGGYDSMEEMIGKTDYDSAWVKEADSFRNIDEMVINQNLQGYSVIEQQTPVDGKTVWLSTTKVAMNDDKGNVIGLVGVSDDVTEKLMREKLLRESENRFRQLSEASSEGVAIHKEGKITDTNLFLAEMFNCNVKELIGLKLKQLLAPEFHKTIEEHLKVDNRLPFRAVGLKHNPFSRNDAPIRFDIEITLRNDPIQAISFRDITQQIKVENIKDDFLANTSHELRTPLNGIIGVSESLIAGVAGQLPAKVKSNLLMIISSSRRLYNLVNDILDYSKMRNESLELEKKPIDLTDLSDLILTLTRPLVVDKPLQLINDIPKSLPAVSADEDRLQQILYNLIGNAIKFTAQGEIRVGAEVQGDRIKISVSDTGIGIPNSRQKEIFKAFQQAESSTKRNYGGSGLGLTISRQLVQLHGSELKVSSIPEKGSTFSFYLSKSEGQPTPSVHNASIPTLTSLEVFEPFFHEHETRRAVPRTFVPQGKGQKILVVDDEPINLQMIKNVLKLHDYLVLSAQSGYQALDILKSNQPDLVILDVMMPRMDGYELCGLIRESFDAWQLPILFLTAKNQVSDRVKGLSSGANDFLTKPFYQEELLIRVKTHLQVKESFETIRENQQLKIEIQRHKQSELEFESSSRRISGILDIYGNALIAVNEVLDIVYLNRQAETILGVQRATLLNRPVNNLLPAHSLQEFQQIIHEVDQLFNRNTESKLNYELEVTTASGERKALQTVVTAFEIEDECIYIFTTDDHLRDANGKQQHLSHPGEVVSNEALHELLKNKLTTKESINFLTSVCNGVISDVFTKLPNHTHHTDVYESTGSNDEPQFYEQKNFRCSLVGLINLSISCWKESTGKSKWQLADESGLWRAYLDQGVYKTRTLNKYLKISTLPNKPKWNLVLDTAEYVLDNYPGLRNDKFHQLESDLSSLMKQINTNIKEAKFSGR